MKIGKSSNRTLILICLSLSGISGFCLSTNAFARMDLVPGSRYTSGRAAALGDAYIPLADDGASGLFYNPAAIGRLQNTHFEPLNMSVMLNGGFLRGTSILNFFKATSLSSMASALQNSPGTTMGGGVSFFPNFFLRGFSFGILTQIQYLAKNDGYGFIRYRSLYQFIPTAGGSLRLAKGIVRLGYSLQYINQSSGAVAVPEDFSPLGYNQFLSEGAALSHTVGFALTFPFQYLPAFNVVARNVMGTRFTRASLVRIAKDSVGTPPEEPMSIDASFSLSPKTGGGGSLNLALEGRDITGRSGMSLLGRLALGLELSIRDKVFLRGGYGSGYPCAGLGMRGKQAEFALSWFSEELADGFHKERDSRFMFHYQIRAF